MRAPAVIPLLFVACAPVPDDPVAESAPPPTIEAPAPPPAWPAAGAALVSLPARPVEGRLLLDAGHGAPSNTGNRNWRCESEADVMRRVADGVAGALDPYVEVTRTRPDEALVPYPDRLRATRAADWLVSLHSDSRAGDGIGVDPSTGCWVNMGAPGFAVLWSDEGDAALVARRAAFARAIGRRVAEAGFLPYAGRDYGGLYAADEVPGVFVDRHDPKKRIMLLRRPKVPSVIVETHQAWDRDDAARWEEAPTWEAFALALAAAIGDVAGE